jgi:hypothetical protein
MALAKAIDEVVWLKRLLHELGFPKVNPLQFIQIARMPFH